MSGKMAGKNPTRHKKIRLTKKQLALAEAAVENPDATLAEIGRKAGYEGDDMAAATSAHRALKSANVREKFRALMAKRPKLQHEALLKKLEEGLEATATKFFAHEGKVCDQEEVIDFPTRHSYLTLAAKLGDIATPEKVELSGAGGADLMPQQEKLPPLTKEALMALIALPEPKEGGAAGKPA